MGFQNGKDDDIPAILKVSVGCNILIQAELGW